MYQHKSKTLNPRWQEMFNFRVSDEKQSVLEIFVYDHDVTGKDDFMGRFVLSLFHLLCYLIAFYARYA